MSKRAFRVMGALLAVAGLCLTPGCGSKGGGGSVPTTTVDGGGGGKGGGSTVSETTETDRVIMPDLKGKTEDEARAELSDRGIEESSINVDERESLKKAGTVIDQVPDSGLDVTGSVNLVVAKPVGVVPDFTGKAISDVRDWASEREIKVREVKVLDDTRAEGEVIGTTPKSGQKASSEIAVQVATKPVVQTLADLEPVSRDQCDETDSGEASVDGTSIQDSLSLLPSYGPYSSHEPCVLQYDFGRDWSRLKATLGIIDTAPVDTKIRLEIFGDDKELYNDVIAFGSSAPLDLDMTDVLRVRIQATFISGPTDAEPWLVLGNLRRIGSPDQVPTTTTTTTP
jgi:hypothetical protein